MDLAVILSFVALAASLGAAGFAGLALWSHRDPPELSALNRRLTDLSLEVTDIADKTGQFIRRQAVRNTRDKQSDHAAAAATETALTGKAALRARVRQRNNGAIHQ